MDLNITNVECVSGGDLTKSVSMRYRLASDPDEEGYYTKVTDIKDILGVSVPFLDMTLLENDDYVLHTFSTADSSKTGTKVSFTVNNDSRG